LHSNSGRDFIKNKLEKGTVQDFWNLERLRYIRDDATEDESQHGLVLKKCKARLKDMEDSERDGKDTGYTAEQRARLEGDIKQLEKDYEEHKRNRTTAEARYVEEKMIFQTGASQK